MPKVPKRATMWKFVHMATRPEGFFVRQGDALEYNSAMVPTAGKEPILVNGRALVSDRLRVKRDSGGKAIRQGELWLWEVRDLDQGEKDGTETWLELGHFSGPKDLEKKLLDFFGRDWGDKVTGPTGALKDGRDCWDRFVFHRPGEQPRRMAEVRQQYWEEQKRQQQQQQQQQQRQQTD